MKNSLSMPSMNYHHKRPLARCFAVVLAVCMLAAALGPSAAVGASPAFVPPRYTVTDLGTFGGPDGHVLNLNGIGQRGEISAAGDVVGFADTVKQDPFAPNCWIEDCYLTHAFVWDGHLHTLPGFSSGYNTEAQWISGTGSWIAGLSQLPSGHGIVAVAWKNGRTPKMFDIGTLGGPSSTAYAVNNRGQVAGDALTKTPDPVSSRTELRPFMWQKGKLTNLGTVNHGPDASAGFINNKGMVAGWSYTDTTIHKTTQTPTQVPFIWRKGRMTGLGSLGGTSGYANDINDHGQIVGQSNLKGDTSFHPFVWSAAGHMRDLGTLGGADGSAAMISEKHVIVGWADSKTPLPGGAPTSQVPHAVLWRHGKITDLGVEPSLVCSWANGVNSSGQVVGASSGNNCPFPYRANLWESGHLMDLNDLIQTSDPSLTLFSAESINNAGEIVARGGIPVGDTGCPTGDGSGGCGRIYLLKPIKPTL
jgi:probable HAF family extracellular repeat protein